MWNKKSKGLCNRSFVQRRNAACYADPNRAATPALTFSAGYNYTKASGANGITDGARYHEVTVAESYSLSKRTLLYALQGYTRALGKTLGTAGSGHIIDATATVGDGFNGTPSSTGKQFVIAMGLVNKF